MTIIRRMIKITGLVQGVGFRPFVYQLASQFKLTGWINNSPGGVLIELEGESNDLEQVIKEIRNNPPPLAVIDKMEITALSTTGYQTFSIKQSQQTGKRRVNILPDKAICPDCLAEIENPDNRRYQYPFTNCTNCGPRFSIIRDLPYDRVKTTMNYFKMCRQCLQEYQQPEDRRYHAQPIACPLCGPEVWLTDNQGNRLNYKLPIKMAIKLLKQDQIIAVKGLGGFHLICNAASEQAIAILRKRKRRPEKPLALMMKSVTQVEQYCSLNKQEKAILMGNNKPILLLRKKNNSLSELIAPGSLYLGIMLPYTPLHYLLLTDDVNILIVTSGNAHGFPLIYKNKEALINLKGIADYFLFHNRQIEVPVDDAVVRVSDNQERIFRIGRGYAPTYLSREINISETILACGSNTNTTICLIDQEMTLVSQYLGKINSKKSYHNYLKVINHFKKIYQLKPEIVAHDLHPGFLTTLYAKEEVLSRKLAVQHHYAHISSCLAENNIKGPVIGLAFDGTGLGQDGRIWGGEFLICSDNGFKRVAHLRNVPLPGGEKAIKEPWRMAIAYLNQAFELSLDSFTQKLPRHLIDYDYKLVFKMIKNKINCLETSSMGRLFAAVSALLGLSSRITFQGQAAIILEEKAFSNVKEYYNYQISKKKGCLVIESAPIIREIILDIKAGREIGLISSKFHNTVINFSLEICRHLRKRFKINLVALSGGVFQNEIIFKGLKKQLCVQGFRVYTNNQVPCNDGE